MPLRHGMERMIKLKLDKKVFFGKAKANSEAQLGKYEGFADENANEFLFKLPILIDHKSISNKLWI